jgi:hypothetical protein
MHSCGNTPIKGCSWPNFWVNLAAVSLFERPFGAASTSLTLDATQRRRLSPKKVEDQSVCTCPAVPAARSSAWPK